MFSLGAKNTTTSLSEVNSIITRENSFKEKCGGGMDKPLDFPIYELFSMIAVQNNPSPILKPNS